MAERPLPAGPDEYGICVALFDRLLHLIPRTTHDANRSKCGRIGVPGQVRQALQNAANHLTQRFARAALGSTG